MSERKPTVIDLNKEDEENEEDPSRNPENVMETESQGDVYEVARLHYPEDFDEKEDGDEETDEGGNAYEHAREEYPEDMENHEEDGESKSKGESEEGDEKAFSIKDLNLNQRFDEEKGFGDLKEGSVVLIDTPLEGGKIGEVVDKEESWTGTLHVKVDTGANQYDVTPYNDDFSEKFVAVVDGEQEVNPNLLERLGKTGINDVEVGNQVVLDAPKVGAIRGTVSHTSKTETQGRKVDVNTGPATFTIYEEPSPTQKKEQAYIVGRIQ